MILPVISMHRSGSSALAGLLHHAGISMGQPEVFIPKPLPENPHGFYENYSFRKVNDELLEHAANCYLVKSWSPVVPNIVIPNEISEKARALILQYNTAEEMWGWKDPRNCLTFEVWLKEIFNLGLAEKLKIIFLIRSPQSVAESLLKRDGLPMSTGLSLWHTYNHRALSTLEKYSLEPLLISYEELCGDLTTCLNRIGDFLGTALEPKSDFFDPELNHSSIFVFESQCADKNATRLAQELCNRKTHWR